MKKIPFQSAAEICDRFDMSDEASALVSDQIAPHEAAEALRKSGCIFDLTAFFAHALPPREGICWAASIISKTRPNDAINAQKTAQLWVKNPNETQRRTCEAFAQELGTGHPIGWLCLAVFWNGAGSIVTPDLPVVLPQKYLHAKALTGAIGLLVPVEDDPRQQFTDLVFATGVECAMGGWPCLEGVI